MPPPDLTPDPELPTTAPPLSLEAALAAQDWTDLSKRLARYAHARLRPPSWETAEEIAQEAIVRLLDPAYASWDRERYPDVFDCLGSIVNGLVGNHRKRKSQRARHVALREDDKDHDDELPQVERELKSDDAVLPPPRTAVHLTDARTAEGELTEARDTADRAELAIATLRARLAEHPLCLRLLDLIQSGVGKPSEQAKALRVSVAEVYALRRRLTEHTRAVARDLAREGES